jgi:hypothetical protein
VREKKRETHKKNKKNETWKKFEEEEEIFGSPSAF